MTVSSVGGSSNASQIAALQKQMQKDVAKLDQDVAARSDAQTLQLDQLAVQADQQQIQALQQAQAQKEALALQQAPAQQQATPGGTNSGVQPGTTAEDGSVYL
jgi:hypothetical protein